jgi:hypothetical protein
MLFDGLTHSTGYGGDLIEVLVHFAITINVSFHHFPVVDSGVAGDSGLGQNKAAVEFGGRYRERHGVDAFFRELDGEHSSIHGGVVIL